MNDYRLEIKNEFEYSLRKLPMWGKKVKHEEINFEWPNRVMGDVM